MHHGAPPPLETLTASELRRLLKTYYGVPTKYFRSKQQLLHLASALEAELGLRSPRTVEANRPAQATLKDAAPNVTSTTEDPLPNIPSTLDDNTYLNPGFDPRTLPVVKLRNILMTHGVDYRFAKKKLDFIALFENHIAPKAAATLQAIAKVKPSNEGITDA
ncbi:hypothetical protein LX32DRAFT_727345 [Colletotrichum zoysiae]|uniref:HeH/LEM domain-containing protein n=1 Tax=Colletotrichum zoysiae TaxID=1216348 RepID=A0AAD9M2B3_9PEZI|nr:hypothetical protein LX32DRAFT_727345 [Colletotrichum zoysiae]